MDKPRDADRYADLSLDLACPKCGSGGLIPLEQLDRLLYCYGCQSRFGVEPQGLVELDQDRIHVHVRRHLSDWEGHEAILQSRSAMFGVWLLDYTIEFFTEGWRRWVLAAFLISAIGVSVAIGRRAPPVKPALTLPTALNERAKMFSEAILRRDMEILIRLTNPAEHRALRIWLAHGQGVPKPIEDKTTEVTAKVANATFTPAGDQANVRVQLSSAGGIPVVVDEQWARRGESWHFQPVRWRSAPISKGLGKPYAKQPRR